MVGKWPVFVVVCVSGFFTGQYSILGAKELSKSKAPPKCKMFFWLALLDRCWTSDRLLCHNLCNNGPCALCSQETETIDHLLLGCVFSREVWFKLLRASGSQALAPAIGMPIANWWLPSRKRVPKEFRKGFNTLVLLVTWELWKERNRRVFQHQSKQPQRLFSFIRDEGRCWIAAGYQALSHFISP